MFVKYSVSSYSFPAVTNPFTCLEALEELDLSSSEGWKCAFLKDNFLNHKKDFLVVFKGEEECDDYYIEKHAAGKGRKVSKFKKVYKQAAVECITPVTDDDSNDNVVCYLDDITRITSNSYCFKIQRYEKIKETHVWRTLYFYSDLAWALKGYLKHFLRKNKAAKERPTVKDLYDLVVDVYKKIELAVEKVQNV